MNLPRVLCMAALVLFGLAAFAQDSTTTQKKIDKVFVGYVYRPPTNINFKLYWKEGCQPIGSRWGSPCTERGSLPPNPTPPPKTSGAPAVLPAAITANC